MPNSKRLPGNGPSETTATAVERHSTFRVRGVASIASDFVSVTGARLVSAALSVVSVALTTRILQPAEYSLLAYATVLATLAFTVSAAWTSAAVPRYGREELERHGAMAAVTWNRTVVAAPLLALAVMAIAGAKAIGLLPPEVSWTWVWLGGAIAVTLAVAEHVSSLLEAAGHMKLNAVGWVVRQAGVVGILLVIVATERGRSPSVIATAIVVCSLLVAVSLGLRVRRTAIWPFAFDRRLLRRMLAFSLPLIAFTIAQQVIASVDLIVIRAFGTARDAGLYALAYQAFMVLQPVALAAISVLVPLFVSIKGAAQPAMLVRYFDRVVQQLAFVAATVAGVGISVVPALVPALFGDDYRDSAQPMAILGVALLFLFAASLVAPILVLEERTKQFTLVTVSAAALNVVGDLVLVGALGMRLAGAAISTTCAMAVVAGGYFVVARAEIGSRSRAQLLLLTPVAGGVASALILPPLLAVVIGPLATLLTAAGVLLATRPFVPADAELVAQLDLPSSVVSTLRRAVARVARPDVTTHSNDQPMR